ncbi:hypothetical protein LTR10_011917 [Elasticomyces elasticus]|nr:hypothetical protein LTR10_011917 [Elasticomyces elasticus]KAK4968860.1 hypothetical protein LTR42_009138 [Elasticomyces elasticus]
MDRDAVSDSFDKRYNKIFDLYEAGDNDKVLEEADNMFHDSGLPRYHRIKLYLLIAAVLDDWEECGKLIERSETLWKMARSFIPPGASQGSEEALAELRESIDSVKAAHQEERNVHPDEPLPPPVKQDPARRDGLEHLRVIRDVAKSEDADQQQQQAEKPRWTKQAPVTEPEPLYHPRHRPLSHMYS